MGVDIEAYSRMGLTEKHDHDPDDCYAAGHVRAFAYVGFERSLRGVADHDVPFTYGATSCVGGRCYRPTAATKVVEVMNTSYGGYGQWRRALCQAALGVPVEDVWKSPDQFVTAPFYEILNFADNEGTIGPEAASELLADFSDHRGLVPVGWPSWDPWDRIWQAWIDGLTLAADGGLVRYS